MKENSKQYSFLSNDFLQELKKYDNNQLYKLSDEIRQFLLDTISKTGGHLAANLGVVELSVALHKVFESPKDRIIWDIGHQSYIHKILTGRANKLHTIRQKNGLCGFTNIFESKHDHFGAGHSSTSISALLGFTAGDKIQNNNNAFNTAVIGDSSIVSGMAFEAMNMLSSLNKKCLVVLNDNNMSISKPVGSLSTYFAKISASSEFIKLRNSSKKIIQKTPLVKLTSQIKKLENIARTTGKGIFFEELGFYYLGPIDGHKYEDLIPILNQIKQIELNKPILLHVKTQKGKGYSLAEKFSEKYHGVGSFNPKVGLEDKGNNKNYTEVYGEILAKQAENNSNIVAVTPAMISGSGLVDFFNKYPKRAFDVGIAEQNSACFAAALSKLNLKVFLSLYSTFSQRAYDQIVHDICLQNLPVTIALDRAGFVGADGPTHHGVLDLNMFTALPKSIILSPTCTKTLKDCVATALHYKDGLSVIRLAKGVCENTCDESYNGEVLTKPTWQTVSKGTKVAIIATGDILKQAQQACLEINKNFGFNPTLVNAIYTKPVDSNTLKEIAQNHSAIITVEEGFLGGFSTFVNDFLIQNNIYNKVIKNLAIRELFVEQASREDQQKTAFIDSDAITTTVKQILPLINQ